MNPRSFHDGRSDGLVPLESLSLDDVDSFSDLLRSMSRTAFSGRQLGEAFDVLLAMVRDKSCSVILTVSGAMTVAKQGGIICDLIDRGLVRAVVATGALVAHGLTESIGLVHYRYEPSHSDEQLYRQGYNRIYDTLEMESNLNDVERLVCSVVESAEADGGTWSSARLCRAIGKKLSEMRRDRGILRSAFERNVPVFIPAFTDSEIGLDVATAAMQAWLQKSAADAAAVGAAELAHAVPLFNPFLDLQEYAQLAAEANRLGIFTIGGGVPRNWAQQVGPFIEVLNLRVGSRLPVPRFRYGVRICPEPDHWGGLSGCTYAEGVSWGKFVPPSEGGRFAEVYVDATAVWPLLIKGVFEELDRTQTG